MLLRVTQLSNRRAPNLVLDRQGVGLRIRRTEVQWYASLIARARIESTRKRREIGGTNASYGEAAVGWKAVCPVAENLSCIRSRRERRVVAEDVVEGWIGIDGVTTAHYHLLVKGRVPGESDARLEILVEVIDRGYGAIGDGQRGIPQNAVAGILIRAQRSLHEACCRAGLDIPSACRCAR